MPKRILKRVGVFVQEQVLVVCVGLAAAALVLADRVSIARTPHIIDFDLLMVLFALLVSVELLRESNLFNHLVASTLHRFTHSRSFVAMMIVLTGLIAALLTNDVALFIVIPFTVLAGRMSGFDVKNAVVLEVVSANLLGSLTPLGNPQNLFVYHQTGWGPLQFIALMLPFCTWSAIGLFVAVPLLEPKTEIDKQPETLARIDRSRAAAGFACFALVVLEILRVAPAWPAAVAAAIALLALLRHRLGEMDLSVVPLFFFAFIVVEGLRSFSVYQVVLDAPIGNPDARLYVTSLVMSQFLSNVPTTILLAPLAGGKWLYLLYGVNAGGCGTIVASLANLLGWRIYGRETGNGNGEGESGAFFRRLTVINFVFLAWIGMGAWAIASWVS